MLTAPRLRGMPSAAMNASSRAPFRKLSNSLGI
jgi:hypothetical protein